MTTYGLLVFDGAEELDFVGPWEVFGVSAALRGGADTAVLIAERPDAVRCGKGMRVLPDHTLDDHPPLDVLLVPGGRGAREEQRRAPAVLGWVATTAARADWTLAVCTGATVLHAAGLLNGRRVATHWHYEDELEATGEVTVVRDARYVVDGDLVTSQGGLGRHRQRALAGRPAARPRPRPRRAPGHPV